MRKPRERCGISLQSRAANEPSSGFEADIVPRSLPTISRPSVLAQRRRCTAAVRDRSDRVGPVHYRKSRPGGDRRELLCPTHRRRPAIERVELFRGGGTAGKSVVRGSAAQELWHLFLPLRQYLHRPSA